MSGSSLLIWFVLGSLLNVTDESKQSQSVRVCSTWQLETFQTIRFNSWMDFISICLIWCHCVALTLPAYHTLLWCSSLLCCQSDVTCQDQTLASLLSRALNALTCRRGWFIKFPSTQEALTDTRHGFYAVVGFPRVIRAVVFRMFPPQTLSMYTGISNTATH